MFMHPFIAPRGRGDSSSGQPTRREFLKQAGVMAAGVAAATSAAAQQAAPLPTVKLGPHQVTRLITGSNPLYGGSHFNQLLNALMREYFTDDRIVQYLLDCERAGINTWQTSMGERPMRLLQRIRAAASKLNWICLAGPWDLDPAKSTPEEVLRAMMKSAELAAKHQPIGIVYHGEISDKLWRRGNIDGIRTFLDGVHDLGIPVGVSSHNPAVIEAIEEKGWPTDFYMACFYRTSRIPEELVKEIGVATVGEPYLATDPERMTRVIRQSSKPCLGFKILAAGRRCDSPQQVSQAFEFAFANIKPTDGVIVGMFPRFADHISENVGNVRTLCA